MARKLWRIPETDHDKVQILAAEYQISTLAATILVNRGFYAPHLAGQYLVDGPLQDPMEWRGMAEATARIHAAIENGEQITIYGDYDCDGVTATALLTDCIRMLGGQVSAYLPNRLTEGYGMNETALCKLADAGTRLIITVDNGISALKEAEILQKLTIDLIVTDHHQPGSELPQAIAVINPHCKGSKANYSDFAGVGVALHLAAALMKSMEVALGRYAELAAIGTIADIVPLTSANRTIVKYGLQQLKQTTYPGLQALMDISGITPEAVTEDQIAFRLSPRINAAGRMADPRIAFDLLMTNSAEEAERLAVKLQECNDRRKTAEQKILNQLDQQIAQQPDLLRRRVLIFSGADWHHGVIGIVSAKLVEQYGKPCFLFAENHGILSGSGRSLGEFSLFQMLSFARRLLIRFGGHKLAAGATLRKEKLKDFMDAVEAYAAALPFLPRPVLQCDAKIEPDALTVAAVSSLNALRPFGAANQSPIFCLQGITVLQIQPLSGGNHTKLICTDKQRKTRFQVLLFGVKTEQFPYRPGALVDLAVTAECRTFRGDTSVSLQLEDIRPADFSEKQYLQGLQRYEAARYHTLTPQQRNSVLPRREQVNMVYAVLKKTSLPVDADLLYLMLSKKMQYDTICLTLDILYEAGILSSPAAVRPVHLLQTQPKMSLHETATYQMLAYETRGEVSE